MDLLSKFEEPETQDGMPHPDLVKQALSQHESERWGMDLRPTPGVDTMPGMDLRQTPGADTMPGMDLRSTPGVNTMAGIDLRQTPGVDTMPEMDLTSGRVDVSVGAPKIQRTVDGQGNEHYPEGSDVAPPDPYADYTEEQLVAERAKNKSGGSVAGGGSIPARELSKMVMGGAPGAAPAPAHRAAAAQASDTEFDAAQEHDRSALGARQLVEGTARIGQALAEPTRPYGNPTVPVVDDGMVKELQARRANQAQRTAQAKAQQDAAEADDPTSELSAMARKAVVAAGLPPELVPETTTYKQIEELAPQIAQIAKAQAEKSKEGFTTSERVAGQTFRAGEAEKERAAELERAKVAHQPKGSGGPKPMTDYQTKKLGLIEATRSAPSHWVKEDPNGQDPFVSPQAKEDFIKTSAGLDAQANHARDAKKALADLHAARNSTEADNAASRLNQAMNFMSAKSRLAEGLNSSDASNGSVERMLGLSEGTVINFHNLANPERLPTLLDSAITSSNHNLNSLAKAHNLKRVEEQSAGGDMPIVHSGGPPSPGMVRIKMGSRMGWAPQGHVPAGAEVVPNG